VENPITPKASTATRWPRWPGQTRGIVGGDGQDRGRGGPSAERFVCGAIVGISKRLQGPRGGAGGWNVCICAKLPSGRIPNQGRRRLPAISIVQHHGSRGGGDRFLLSGCAPASPPASGRIFRIQASDPGRRGRMVPVFSKILGRTAGRFSLPGFRPIGNVFSRARGKNWRLPTKCTKKEEKR